MLTDHVVSLFSGDLRQSGLLHLDECLLLAHLLPNPIQTLIAHNYLELQHKHFLRSDVIHPVNTTSLALKTCLSSA